MLLLACAANCTTGTKIDCYTDCVNYCKSNGIENPVEILRYAQSLIVTGRPLDVQDVTVSLDGETNFILINRQDVLRSAMEEVQFLKDPRLTLAVGLDIMISGSSLWLMFKSETSDEMSLSDVLTIWHIVEGVD